MMRRIKNAIRDIDVNKEYYRAEEVDAEVGLLQKRIREAV